MAQKPRTVVITGGTSGIGAAIAKRFSDENVIVFGRRGSCSSGTLVQGDVKNLEDLDRLYNQTGEIDLLVASAGISGPQHISEETLPRFEEMVAVNLRGVYFSVQKALPYMKKGSCIILISSLAAKRPYPGFSLYSATKAAVSHLVPCLAVELAPQNIRVNGIAPGFIDTPMNAGYDATQVTERLPSKRMGTSEEIAETAHFIAGNKYMNGQEIIVDGGMAIL